MRAVQQQDALAEPQPPAWERRIAVVLLVVAVAGWVPPQFRSLWLDEGLTDWIARSDSFATMWERAREYQVGSIYFVVPWVLLRIVPDASEALLRLPSMLAVFGAAAILARVGGRLVHSEAGAYMALFLLLQANVVEAALNARSYASGLLLVSASLLFLLRWLDHARWGDGVGFVACAGLAVDVHLLLGAFCGAEAVYAIASRRAPLRQLAPLALLGGLFAAPAIPALLQTLGRRGLYDWAPTPGPFDLIAALLPLLTVLGLASGLLVARAFGSWEVRPPPGGWRPHVAGLLFCWIFPVLALFAISLVGSSLFVPRYLIGAAPFSAVLLGLAVSHLADPRARLALAAGATAAAFLAYPLRPLHGPDQGGIVARLAPGPDTPMLYRTGLIESQDPTWLEDPRRREYFLASMQRYPLPGKVILLPYSPGPEQQPYLEGTVLTEIGRADRFLVVGTVPLVYEEWIRQALEPAFDIRVEEGILVGERAPAK